VAGNVGAVLLSKEPNRPLHRTTHEHVDVLLATEIKVAGVSAVEPDAEVNQRRRARAHDLRQTPRAGHEACQVIGPLLVGRIGSKVRPYPGTLAVVLEQDPVSR